MQQTPTVADFEPVRRSVLCQLVGRGFDNWIGSLYLNVSNLHYIFHQYIRRYENETGWQVDPQTHRLDSFSALMFDAYLMGMCKYQAPLDAPRMHVAQLVNQWNEDTINGIVFEALKETRKKVNYLRRARDPLYGRRSWNPIQVTKPRVEKVENSYRYAYRNMPKQTSLPYAFAVPDE